MSLTLTLERGGGEVSGSGTNIELDGTIAGGAIESVEMYGDTEQTTYSGKNLYEGSPSFNAFVGVSGWEDGGTYNGMPVIKRAGAWGGAYKLLNVEAGNTYTFSLWIKADQARQGSIYSSGSSTGATATITPNAKTLNISTSWERVSLTFECSASGTVALRVENWTSSDTNYTYIAGYQLEVGSSMTSFEPYVGGTASPNPDYPQEVKTVTGEQTITISDGNSQSQSYTVDLGSIELCKIGTYQDYIYKSGEDWYLHKDIEKFTMNGSENWSGNWNNPSTPDYWTAYLTKANFTDNYVTTMDDADSSRCDYFTVATAGSVWNLNGYGYALHPDATYTLQFKMAKTFKDNVNDWKTWLGTHTMSLYYPLATPTDTQITNSALITQLEALNEAQTYDGKTIITVSSENLAGSLEVTVSTNIAKTYTEVEIGSPFTITDVEGKSSNTTLDGNVYVDWAYNKKQYSFDLFNLTPQDYADIRAFYDYQFNNSAFPTITVPELNIDKLPVYMEISSRNIINQCLLTDKLTIKFRETVQP